MHPLPFHPVINTWFSETYGKPTPVQEEAWPLIRRGEHVLAIAPTGSGKTLTGFLSAISSFAEGRYPANKLSVLYVSPLKALNEDIKRNLIKPLEGIRAHFEKAGTTLPLIHVETRSGDSTQTERRRFLISPPSILALTPESLAILLLNNRAREHLSHVKCLILDEIHACLGTRRGAFLSCQIDHLSLLAGDFRRIALSATVNPPEAAASFAGGLRANAKGGYEKRKVVIVQPQIEKKISFKVEFPEGIPEEIRQKHIQEKVKKGKDRDDFGERYDTFIAFAIEHIRKNRSTLIYTDSRRRAERICYLINQSAGEALAFSHHGSLSKDLRRAAEKALAEGQIPCVVATSSLELGIDIGSIDEVILAGSPFSASSALQRVGRSGHSVGEESRGILFPFHGLDLIASAAIAGAVEERELEESTTLDNPLDVLSQIILSICTQEDRYEEELYATIRGFYVFSTLPRAAFDAVISMLSGGYSDKRGTSRLRELPRRLFRDSETGLLSAAPGTRILLYTSGGVIANRGYFSMRLAGGNEDAGSKIGELDEEFVWERRIGDTFNFGGRSWRISAIGSEAVEVFPLARDAGFTPFWKADAASRGKVITRRILELMDSFDKASDRERKALLSQIKNLSPETVEALYSFLKAQKSFQGKAPLPGQTCIPVEVIEDPASGADARLIIFHSFRGTRINSPLSLCLMGDLEEHWNMRVETTVDNNAVMLRLPASMPVSAEKVIRDSFMRLGQGKVLEDRLSEVLSSSGVFNAAFRESAEASMLIPRSPFGKRIPLWITRQKSKRLFDAVSPFKNFPVITEALRTCLNEHFDMQGIKSLVQDILDGSLNLPFFSGRVPSPFSRELLWLETGTLLYEYDERKDLRRSFSSGQTSLSDLAIAETLIPGASRPPLDRELVADFSARLRREKEGWAPEDSLSFCEWVKERVCIPKNDEWENLVRYIPDELKKELSDDPTLNGRLSTIKCVGAEHDLVVHRDFVKTLQGDPEEITEKVLAQWLRGHGPVPTDYIREVFGFSPTETKKAIDALIEIDTLIDGIIIGESESSIEYVCDKENFELLLRLGRKKRRAGIKERPIKLLVPFLARRQGLVNRPDNPLPWEVLHGYSAPAKLWETELLPARNGNYRSEYFDREIREGRLIWYGTGKERAAFCAPLDLDLVSANPPAPENFPPGFFDIPKSFWQIKEALGLNSIETAGVLWKLVWQGSLSSDSWEPVREAIGRGFNVENLGEEIQEPITISPFGRSSAKIPRSIRERWRSGPPIRGNWFSLAGDFDDTHDEVLIDPLSEDEINRARVRLLLKRYGLLCRPLLENEDKCFSWSRLLPVIRRMELAGELIAGRFFSGINSLQFASPRIAEELEEAEAEQSFYMMNALDPASPVGFTAEGLLPDSATIRRLPSTRLCYKGPLLLAVSNRGGKDLEIYLPAGDPDLPLLEDFLKFPKNRAVQSETRLIIEKINGIPASMSEYRQTFVEFGFIIDRGRLVLW
ncbi:MAG: DEAD/DEAH box helicase [Treponema sp.]|nr:DEAD/DEAH box helicase [Treponema sp.]